MAGPYFPQVLPASTVVGNLSTSDGNASAVPIASLAAAIALGGPITSTNCTSIAALKALTPPTALSVALVLGFTTSGDGGWGIFYWNVGDTTADDGSTCIQPNAGGTGRWRKL